MRNPFDLLRMPGSGAPPRRRVATRAPATPPRPFERGRFDPTSRASRPDVPRGARVHISWRRVALTTVGLTLGGSALYGAAWLLNGETFRVQAIEISGLQVADAQAVARASGIADASLLTLDGERATQAIAKLPAVKSATVTRHWPHAARIAVVEHQAWGYWQAGSQRLVIDEDGRVLQQSRPPAADAPTIVELAPGRDGQTSAVTDADTVRLVRQLRTDGTLDRLRVRPTGYFFRRDRGLTVMVADGPAAVFGDSSNYDFKVRTWEAVLAQQRQNPGLPSKQVAQPASTPEVQAARQPGKPAPEKPAAPAVAEIDLRFGRNVVMR